MRYLALLIPAELLIIAMIVSLASGLNLPMSWLVGTFLIATAAGFGVSIIFVRSLHKQLSAGQSDFLSHKPSGGKWFFSVVIVFGLLISLIAIILSIPIIVLQSLFLGAFICIVVNFGVVGAYVLWLEYKESSHILMNDFGFFFERS